MNYARFAVNRPVTILMGILATVVLGILAWSTLKVDLLPDITFPVISVVTVYPGAGPQEVEEYITKPIEQQCGLVRNLKHLSSSSQEGVSVVTEEFDWGADMDYASFDTREKVDQVLGDLPDEAKRPYIVKMDPQTMIPIMTLNVSGMADQRELRKFTDDYIKRDLEKVQGVAALDVYGGLEREIQVLVNPDRLAAYNLSVQQIQNALAAENVNIPAGHIELGRKEFTVRTVGEFKSVDQIGDIAIGSKNGVAIRLRDVATVSDTHKDVRQFSRLDRKPSITLVVRKESGANAVDCAHAMRKEVAALNQRLPGKVQVTETYASADSIERSLHNMYGVAEEGAILAVVIIFLFLSSFRSTLIIALSIPLSILTTAVAMKFHNMTLNVVTLGGLTLAIGRIVDDSIVVIENVFHHVEIGETPYKAAVRGAGEVGMAIVAATLTTVCVFLPLAVVGGLVGVFFTPLALTVTIALLSSLVVALTVIPMIAARALRPRTETEDRTRNPVLAAVYGGLAAWERGYNRVEELYGHAVAWCLRHRGLVTGLAVGIFLFSASLVPLLGSEFFPSQDQGEFQLSLQMPVGVNVQATNQAAEQMENMMLNTPEITLVTSTVGEAGGTTGGGGGTSVRNANFQVKLKPAKDRTRTTDQVIAELRDKFKTIPGAQVSFATGFSNGQAPFILTITGDDISELARIGQTALDKMKKVPGLVDLRLNWEQGAPEYQVVIDRRKAGLYGLTTSQIAGTVRTLIRGTETTKYREGGKQYDITVRLPKMDREDIDQIKNITLPAVNGQQVPFGQVAKIVETRGPTQVSRYEQQRSIDILGDLTHKRPLNDITRDTDAIMAGIPKPVGYAYQYRGDEQNRRESFAGFFIAIALGILLIYIILASQFESVIQPLIIMLAIPLEAIGAFLALLITHTTVSMMVLMGLLLLTGIVVSNSILLVQVVNVMKAEGASTTDALIRGGRRRLRPILMTAMATLLAMLPVALALREGSGMWRPLGITVLGGLFSSTFLTLLVVPVAYSLVDDLAHKLGFRSAVSTHPIDTDGLAETD